MNILVVHPPYLAKREIVYLPIGLGYITAIAERSGHDVTVFDMHNLRLSFRKLEAHLKKKTYQACLMGGFALQVESMARVTRLLKSIQPQCQVIAGGVGVSDIPEIALNYIRADAISIGESEKVLPDFLRSVQDGKNFGEIPGFVYQIQNRIVKQPKAAAPENLDALPYPAYHKFDVEYISRFSYNGRGQRSIHIMTSRGCPFKCNFCINSVLNNRSLLKEIHGEIEEEPSRSQRFRSLESLVREIEFLRSTYGIDDFHFADEEFITHRRRLEEVCRAIEPLGITWSTSGRADWATEDKLARMKKAGCSYVLFGVETGSQKLLDLMDKNAKKPAVSQGLRASRKVGMDFIANFMIGHSGETEETIRETVEFCKEHRLIFLPNYVTLFPNSKMFHDFSRKIPDWAWYFQKLSRIDFTRNLFINLTQMSDFKLIRMRNWAVAETFSAMVAPSFKGLGHHVLTRFFWLGIMISDLMPNALRWILRNIVRNFFDFSSKKRIRNASHQIPPHDFGQLLPQEMPDAYEESLKELSV